MFIHDIWIYIYTYIHDIWMKERMKARAPQEEKAKDTVLINGIGFVAVCVSRRNSAVTVTSR